MSETNETLADIVAVMRRGTKLPGYWRSCDLNEILQYHADRIEAAWRREKTVIEADALAVGGIVEAKRKGELSKARPKNAADFGQFGNAAAMREAVVLALSLLDLKEGVPYKTISQKDIDFMKAALAAPARNCDLPLVVDGPANNNADKAWIVFKRHNPDAYFDVPGLLRCIDWLLAPATDDVCAVNCDRYREDAKMAQQARTMMSAAKAAAKSSKL